jgi:hypothetical protein
MFGRIVRGLVTHDPAAIARANAGGLMDAAREFVEPSDAPRRAVRLSAAAYVANRNGRK